MDSETIPPELDENHLLTIEELCALISVPATTVDDWRRLGVGPRWWRFCGTGRLYTTAGEMRRYLSRVAQTEQAIGHVQ